MSAWFSGGSIAISSHFALFCHLLQWLESNYMVRKSVLSWLGLSCSNTPYRLNSSRVCTGLYGAFWHPLRPLAALSPW